MKSNAIIDFMICVDSIRMINFGNLAEGMYQIRMNLYINNNQNLKIPITPKEIMQLQTKQNQYLPGHCIDNFYMTDAFLLRFWTFEEKFDIKNACRFSASVPYHYKDYPVYMEVELMFYDLDQSIVSFASLSLSKYKLENVCQGLYEFAPIILQEDHFAQVNVMILASLVNLDFKFTELRPQKQQQGKEDTSIQMKQLYNKVMDPLRNSYKAMQHFFNNMELEMERASSSGGTQYFRQSKSFQVLPYTTTESLLKNENNVQLLSRLMANEFKVMRTLLSQLWTKILQAIRIQSQKVFRSLKKESLINYQSRFSAFTTKEVIPVVDHQYTMIPQTQKQSQDLLDLQNKRSDYYRLLQGPSRIIDMKIIDEVKDKLVIFEKHYVTRPAFQLARNKFHLIVLVHGYQGNCYDMMMIENYMRARFPQHTFLNSKENCNTEIDILTMGKKLSEEIQKFIAECKYPKFIISFVAHSLGGLIVRAALPFLDYEFYTLMTLGSPHLGYITNDKPLIRFGMWFFQKMKKSQSLAQLNCQDDTLLKLSKYPGMNKFKNIILFGSKQDHYVTSESSLLLKIQSQENIHNQMATNILKQLHQNEILRIVVDYKFYDGDFDTFLGRKAHIAILESHFLNQYIIYNLGDYFR